MLEEFKNFIQKEDLFLAKAKLLLAVSGGVDSVVMTDLFKKAGYHFGIAHCNFQLRGEESDLDYKFVKDLAKKYSVPFFSEKFNTKEYAEENGLSIQMAARTLRYNWFDKLLKAEKYTYLATAHHLDDQVETFFINLLHGTGISGLHGILPKINSLVHPMMFTYRENIEKYAKENNLQYREDSSNRSIKYKRNRLRLQIIPQMQKLNPELSSTINKNIERFREIEYIYREAIEKEREKVFFKRPQKTLVSIPLLRNLHPLKTYLYEFLSPYGFSFPIVCDIAEALDDISGKQFFSSTYRIIKDRELLIITKRKKSIEEEGPLFIYEDDSIIENHIKIEIKKFPKKEDMKIPSSRMVACLDIDKVKFPLQLRKWQKGDYFYPLGMNTRKKISDFFIDNKFSIIDKENTWLLCSGKRIIWIVGYRIDDRFKVTPDTRNIIQLKVID